VVIALCAGIAHAGSSTSEILRDGNTAAVAGEWSRVLQLVEPLFSRPLGDADRAEAHRLAAIAECAQLHSAAAERHVLAYLRIEPFGQLDPALYPPDVVALFNDVAARHAAELHLLRSPPRRSWLVSLVPPFGQLQNGDRTKAYVLGGTLGVLLATNLTTYYFLSKWCQATDGPTGGGLSCYNGGDHNHQAARIRPTNIATGIGFLVVYAYGVADGLWGYHRQSHARAIEPFAAASADGGVLGMTARF
jgi:hypothetical protein